MNSTLLNVGWSAMIYKIGTDYWITNPKVGSRFLTNFSQLNGIGKGTIERIKEILSNGHLSELESLHDETKESNISDKLEDVIGIGKSTAAKLIKLGIKSVKDLKANIKNKRETICIHKE